jgi:hypothetical protein
MYNFAYDKSSNEDLSIALMTKCVNNCEDFRF